MSYSNVLKTYSGKLLHLQKLLLKYSKYITMTKFEKRENTRNRRVTKLLWFSFGFLFAFGIMSLLKS